MTPRAPSILSQWRELREWPPLETNALHVWRLSWSAWDEAALTSAAAYLTDEEFAQAEHMQMAAVKQRFIATRSSLRRILAGYLAGGEYAAPETARALCLQSGAHGKPALVPPRVRFNLTHTDENCLIAVAAHAEVGIDMEAVTRQRPLERIVRRFFSPAEQAALSGLAGDALTSAFYRIWTRKEAVIKALGEGLACPLHSFDVSADGEARLLAFRRPEIDVGAWRMLNVDVSPDYATAVAVRGPVESVSGYTFTPHQHP
ncbi:MAG TPA: 4'-phosphopantetheinyl transferase superfamily protein [Kiritimatiellia bacterium]|nr:4'-phosphopantetheinyl transferase superfamily protein [Kiritimatiellia bacterium]HMO52470.1 4'-phosphopantetheinyl transferase superfamily protein [Kiritimatiellia bacterium]HMP97799.1 4'-phosphopantetheinyl transferase superfamily protein [Kiritimatiellia bacterium]